MTDPNISYWLVVLRNALDALEAATGKSSLNAAGRQLTRAKQELHELGVDWRAYLT